MDGIFIVDARTAQTLTWDQNLSAVSFGNTVELNASASSNLAVTYDIGDESIASLVVTRDYHLDAWWRLDENGSVTQGADSAGNNRLLSTYGPTWTLGKFRNGLSFDGTDDWAQAFGYKGITGGNKRTYSFWLKTATAGKGILLRCTIRGWELLPSVSKPMANSKWTTGTVRFFPMQYFRTMLGIKSSSLCPSTERCPIPKSTWMEQIQPERRPTETTWSQRPQVPT